MKHKIIGNPIKNMPWEEKPAGSDLPMWRFSGNPITKWDPIPGVARVYNSALVPWGDEFIGVFRGDRRTYLPTLYVGHSKDGIHIEFEENPINITLPNGDPFILRSAYDPRVIPFEDRWYVIYCGEHSGPVLAMLETKDFKHFTFLDEPFLPYNRNGVLFPRKINGDYCLLSRPSGIGHNEYGDIWLSRSKDLVYWGKHEKVLGTGWQWWNGLKVGAGCVPIETDMGWLLFYHGVGGTCSGLVYCFGAVILDKDNPEKVLHRCSNYLVAPQEWYETSGYVANVVFPVSALADSATGRIAVYYGCSDTYTSIAFTDVDTLIDYILKYEDKGDLPWR